MKKPAEYQLGEWEHMHTAEATFCAPLYSRVQVTLNKDYPTAHVAFIHKSKTTHPACSTTPASQSKGRVPPA